MAAGRDSEICDAAAAVGPLLGEAACRAAMLEIDATLALLDERRFACRELESRLCADLGEDSDACAIVREEIPRFPFEQCEMMLREYGAVLDQLRRMEAQNAPLSGELWGRLLGGSPPSAGPEDAAVALVVFSDYLCPACRGAAETIAVLREHYEGLSLRIVMREFPLDFHGTVAALAAEASLEAHAQGRFWEMHDALFAAQGNLLDRAAVDRVAESAGLDMEAYRAAMDERRWRTAVEADVALGGETLLSGTPTFFLDGKQWTVDWSRPESCIDLLDEALRAAAATPESTPESEPESEPEPDATEP